MKRSKTPTFVVTLPLVVRPGESKSLLATMEAARRLYNSALGESLRRYALLKNSDEWDKARSLKDKKERSKAFITLRNKGGFTPSSIITFARERKNEAGWSDRLGSNVTQQIAQRAFSSVEEYSFGIRGKPRFKGQKRPLHSIQANDNKSNIYWRKETGCVKVGKLVLPAMMPSNEQDPYLNKALESDTKFCRILWRNENNQRRWYLQLMQTGTPPVKEKFSTVHDAVVGLDIGPSTVAVVSDLTASLVKFCATIEEPWKVKRRIQRKMDRSKRATNPQCFNKNGTCKKGAKLVPSNRYKAMRSKLAETERKLAAERKRSHGELSNEVIKLGNVIQSETLSYKAFQKMYGKSVKVRAPGMFVDLLRRKAERAGGKVVDLHTWSLKMSQYDHTTETYTKKPLSQRWHELGDGSGVAQRDIYSAFLARCVIGDKHHPSHIDPMWATQKLVLLRTGWLRLKPAKIEPSGKITVAAPSERVVRESWLGVGYASGNLLPENPDTSANKTPCL